MDKHFRIALLLNANKAYDRQIIEGICEYLYASPCDWNIFLEDDFITRVDTFNPWEGDGVIADYESPQIAEILDGYNIPIVGVGGSYLNEREHPNVPYVVSDDRSLVTFAFNHLKDKGLEHFAFYGMPDDSWKKWAKARKLAFENIIQTEGYTSYVYLGHEATPQTWMHDMEQLADWIKKLPKPIGIISVCDARARHLLQICDQLNIIVPNEVSIIGIDNDEIARCLSRVSLSSVGQNCKEIGYQSAKLLHRLLDDPEFNKDSLVKITKRLVQPTKVYERQSTDFRALNDPYVIQAVHYISNNARKKIRVDQVLEYIGISRTNMEVRFRDILGHSIHQEIYNAKLKQACNLLTTTSLPLAEISEICGYTTLQYMYKVFKKNLAKTPKEYREFVR